MVRNEGQNISKFLHALDFLKMQFPNVNKLLESFKKPQLKVKMFFETETLNPNNEKYLVKTIGYSYSI